jgi:hypothetical protein
MTRIRHFVAIGLIALAASGCHKQIPITAARTLPPPELHPQPLPSVPEIVTLPPPPAKQPTETASNSTAKPPRNHRPRPKSKPSPSTPSPNQPPAVAENRGPGTQPRLNSPTEPLITTTPGDQSRSATVQLLESTDRSLLSLGSNVSQDVQNTIQQIRGYEKDAREALRSDDLERAHNLAKKAKLLADTLVPPR